MLALHVVGLERRNGHSGWPDRTLIFDEVDAGIGGRVADAVGESLRSLGARFQVLCITHLAGIAARATAHFAIAKQAAGGRTTTHVDRLDGDARVGEIARMLTGAQQSDASRAAAAQLLELGDYMATGESRSRGKGRKRKS
jgi:DNA repair protein RecN (Recombination protein N)